MVSPRDGWPRRGRTRLCTYPRADHRNRAAVAARTGREGAALAGALVLAFVVTLQAALGIVTLMHQAPLALALLHQAMAIAVLTVAVVHAQRLAPASESASAAEHTGLHGREQAT